MSDNQNNNQKGIIIGMLCLIWGLGSIAAMLFCSKLENHTGILLVLFGQFFLVIGLIAVICNRKAKPYPFILLVFPLAGIALLVCGICILTKGEIALSMMDHFDLDISACRYNYDSKCAWKNPIPEAGMYTGGSGKMY